MNILIRLTKLSFSTIKNGLIKTEVPKVKIPSNLNLNKFREEAREMGRKFRKALEK